MLKDEGFLNAQYVATGPADSKSLKTTGLSNSINLPKNSIISELLLNPHGTDPSPSLLEMDCSPLKVN
jgi:hypothetical protein